MYHASCREPCHDKLTPKHAYISLEMYLVCSVLVVVDYSLPYHNHSAVKSEKSAIHTNCLKNQRIFSNKATLEGEISKYSCNYYTHTFVYCTFFPFLEHTVHPVSSLFEME